MNVTRSELSDDAVQIRMAASDDGKTTAGFVHVPPDAIFGRPRYVDGYAVAWTTGEVQLTQEYVEKLAAEHHFSPAQADKVPRLLLRMILVTIPDYPSEETVTYAIPDNDLDAFIDKLREAQAEMRAVTDRDERIFRARVSRATQEVAARRAAEAVQCAEPNCHRPRAFFDNDGVGWCKRHAEAHGVRTKGKP